MMKEYRCNECGGPCGIVEETFDYSGTHCNNGITIIHHTGDYVSDCCLADYHAEEGPQDDVQAAADGLVQTPLEY